MEKALKRMTAAELEQAKPEHLAKRSAMPKYAKRGIRFTDVMVEPGGRYRYDIVTVNGIKAERITMHELNSMLDISTERVRPGCQPLKHDENVLMRLRQYQEKWPDLCKYIKANDAKWKEMEEQARKELNRRICQ